MKTRAKDVKEVLTGLEKALKNFLACQAGDSCSCKPNNSDFQAGKQALLDLYEYKYLNNLK